MKKETFIYNPELLERLKNSVEIMFGQSISTTNEAFLLATDISKKVKKNINYNTLRRVFKIVPSDTQPSIFTVNALAQYVGHTDWHTFCTKIISYDQNILFDSLHVFKLTRQIDLILIQEYSEKYGRQNNFHYFLREVITLAYGTKNYRFFKSIFKLQNVFEDVPANFINIYYTVHALALCVRKDKLLQDIAVKNYSVLPFKDNFYVELFVDVENINGYYGKILDRYIKHKKDKQATLFYHCMKFYGAYFKRDFMAMSKNYKIISQINDLKGIYTIPVARKRVCEALYNAHVVNKKPIGLLQNIISDIEYFKKASNSLDHLVDYMAYLSQGLFWAKQYEIIVKVTDEYLLINSIHTSHLVNNTFNFLNLYYAASLFKLKHKSKAKEFINKVDVMKFKTYQFEMMSKDFNYYFKAINK